MSVLALKLWEIAEQLDERLDDPGDVLETLVTLVAKGEQPTEVWDKLHAAAARFDKTGELAFSYEQVTQDKRIKLLSLEQQAFIFSRAAHFFAEVFRDSEGAIAYAERALAVVPGEPQGVRLLEALLIQTNKLARLAELYVQESARETDAEKSLSLAYRAFGIALTIDVPGEFVIDLGNRILRSNPADGAVRDEVMRRLLVGGRHRDVVDLLEQALRREPPPPPEESVLHREQLIDLCFSVLADPERALTHVEGLLAVEPSHAMAQKAATELLGNPQLMSRAAAALSDAFELLGEQARAVEMLELELQHVRGPRRVEVQRRLGILRQDALSDREGALELLGPVVAGDPGDDALRRRFLVLNLELNQPEQAARLLARVVGTHRDASVRARVGVDVAQAYLAMNDLKRAEAALQKVVETNADEAATLASAKKLAELYASAGDTEQLAGAVELIVLHEAERESRQAAARKLAQLSEGGGPIPDRARLTLAYRALVGSPWTDEALDRLESLYREAGNQVGLADVFGFRAEREEEPERARALGVRALELRTGATSEPAAKLDAYRRFVEKFGPSRAAHAGMIPLLEELERYEELVEVLLSDIDLAPSEEQIELWARVAEVRLKHLHDPESAIEALAWTVALEPTHKRSREALEELLSAPRTRSRVASILEPLYRRQKHNSGLFRVLEAKLRGELDVSARLVAAEEAVRVGAETTSVAGRALEVAGRALQDAVEHAPDQVNAWLAKVQALGASVGDSSARARALEGALGARAVDNDDLLQLARALGDALSESGEPARAIQVYRRALAFRPGASDLLSAIDRLLAAPAAAADRLALYEAALAEEGDPSRRTDQLRSMAELQRFQLEDRSGAAASLRRALGEDPNDLAAHESLVDVLLESGDHAGAAREIERVFPTLTGEAKLRALGRLAAAQDRAGAQGTALASYRELLASTTPEPSVLLDIERLATVEQDASTLAVVLERRLAGEEEPRTRAELLERLADICAGTLGDAARAAPFWLEGARLAGGTLSDPDRARRLYERLLEHEPRHPEAAAQLVTLAARSGDFARVVEAFSAMVGAADTDTLARTLTALEEPALATRSSLQYARLVDIALARGLEPEPARRLTLAKARALAAHPAAAPAARELLRQLLEGAREDAVEVRRVFREFVEASPDSAERAVDLRLVYASEVEAAEEPLPVLFAWARAEEQELRALASALTLYEQILVRDPDNLEAHLELSRIHAETGDAEAALSVLEGLRDRSAGERRVTAELAISELLLDKLGRAEDALSLVGPMLEADPSHREALRVVQRALAVPRTRARAADLLERAALAFDDPARKADVIEALLAVSADVPELAEARSRWMTQLLSTRSDDPEAAMALALRAAEAAPNERELWDFAEQMARKLGKPEPLAESYARVFTRELKPELADELGRSMIDFYEEWFDDPERVIALLERVLALCPQASWPFDRLKLAFNNQGRWQALFGLYDTRLAAPIDAAVRIEILREAAMAARDFAGDPERAMAYLEALNRAAPGDGRVEASLERLYERHTRKRPLIELLSARLAGIAEAERPDLELRIANLWLDLDEAEPALDLALGLLGTKTHLEAAVHLMERVIPVAQAQSAESELRKPVLLRATGKLKSHYATAGSVVDVVRILEIEERAADSATERRALLEQIVRLRLKELKDLPGAFETIAALVLLDPESPGYRKNLAELGRRIGAEARRAEVLVAAARTARVSVRTSLLNEAASVHRHALGDQARAIELYREVLQERDIPAPVELAAARELVLLLRTSGEPLERVVILERLAEIEDDPALRRTALGEAAELSFERLGDAPRAIVAYRRRIADDPRDLEAMNGLCRALESAQAWEELIAALEARAAIAEADAARADRIRIAELYAAVLEDRRTAIEAWRRVVALHGGDEQTFRALSGLLTVEERWEELCELVAGEVATTTDRGRKRELLLELGALNEERTSDFLRALEAYVAAEDWQAAVRVTSLAGSRPESAAQVSARLLELSVSAWQASRETSDTPAALAADFALDDLCRKLLDAGDFSQAVERMLAGARLPLPTKRRRELTREAACLVSDKLADPDRSIELFQSILEEDAADDIATSCVTRLALLLEEKGSFDVIATLWENQATARAATGDVAAAQTLWARAGEIAEERLEDLERARAAYERGAELGGEASLEALARMFTSENRTDQVARVLERLTAISPPDALAERALRLADAYVQLGKRSRARDALEQALPRVGDGGTLRKQLGVLYREAEDYAALASLLEEEASRAPDARTALSLLKEAAELHLERRKQPAPAVPLLARALALDPEESGLRVRYAQALYDAERFAEAADALREQIARYGARRPKERALVHYELARALLAISDRGGALAELDAAARIDPAHPNILLMLARTALDEGDLNRAERMFRALLLVTPRQGEQDASNKSEALLALAGIARSSGDLARYDEFVSSAFEAAQESRSEAQTLEEVLRGADRPELLARALELRLSQGLPAKEAARCLADLCELHDSLGDASAVHAQLVRRARALEEELVRRDTIDDDAWSSLGRVYSALGDPVAEGRVLERRVEASARSSRPPPGPDLYFRLASVRLGDSKTLDQGLDLLEGALDQGLETEAAETLLRRVFPEGTEPPRVLHLFEKTARAQGDRAGVLRVLARRAARGDADMNTVREGVALAEELGEAGLGDQLLQTAIATRSAQLEAADAAWLRLELAKRHRRMGEVAAALSLEEEAAEYLGGTEGTTLLLATAREAHALGDTARAGRLYALLRRDDPANAAVFRPLIELYRTTGESQKLLSLIEETLPLIMTAEEQTPLRLEQAELLLHFGKKERAIALLRDVVRDDPKERAAHARLFELLDSEGREDELIELFDSEIDAQRDRGDREAASALTLRLVAWLERHGRVREAIAACRAARELDPGRRELLDTQLRLAESTEEPELIGDALEKMLETERGPSAAALARRLLALREAVGDSAGAERALELGFTACPTDLALCDRLAEVYVRWGDLARVADLYERALAARPGDAALLERQVEAYRAAGRQEEALGALAVLGEQDPGASFVRRTRASLLSELGRHGDAVLELETAAASDPSLTGELVTAIEHALFYATAEEKSALGRKLVDALEAAGDGAAARARLDELVAASPDDPELLLRLAELEARSGGTERALEIYTRLLDLADERTIVPVALGLAELYERSGQPAKARPALERALVVDRENAALRARLVSVLEADGAYRALAELLREEAERETRRDERAKKLLRVGELLLLPDGDLEQAVALLESVRGDLRDSVEVIVQLGRAYGYAGQRDKALALLDGCIDANRGKRVRALSAVYEQKADIHLDEGATTEGVAALARAFEMDPKNARLGMRFGRLALGSGEVDAAQRALRAVAIMKTAPVDGPDGARSDTKADANFMLAELAIKAGDPRKARVLAAKALSENPEHSSARSLLATLDSR